jgi:hypothetical protein
MVEFMSLLDTAKKNIEEEMMVPIQSRNGESNSLMLTCMDVPFLD